MGNSPAGSRLGDAGGGGSRAADAALGERHLLEIEVRNQLGLPLTLVRESFSDGGVSMLEVPKAVSSSGKLRAYGKLPKGVAVYASAVSYRPSTTRELDLLPMLPGQHQSRAMDLRPSKAEQFLAVAASWQESTWLRRPEEFCFGAVYGSFGSVELAAADAERTVSSSDGASGLCSWRIEVRSAATEPFRVTLELKKPEASRHSALLASRDGPAPAPAVAPRAGEGAGAGTVERKEQEAAANLQGGAPTGHLAEAPAGALAAALAPAATQVASPPILAPAPAAAGPVAPAAPAPAVAAAPARPRRLARAPRPPVVAPREAAAAAALARLPAAPPPAATSPVSGEPAEMALPLDTCQQLGQPLPAPSPVVEPMATLSPEAPAPEAGVLAQSAEELGRLGPQAPESTGALQAAAARPKAASRSGMLALTALAAADEAAQQRHAEATRRRQEEEAAAREKEQELAAAALARQEELLLRQAQDQEFQQSLLMDQLKDLMAREKVLAAEAKALALEAEEAEATRRNALQRLERFGENPRLSEEAARSEERLLTARQRQETVVEELDAVSASLQHSNELLAVVLASGD